MNILLLCLGVLLTAHTATTLNSADPQSTCGSHRGKRYLHDPNDFKCKPPPREPNIVIILADDVGIGDITAYDLTAPVPTPNIDALAAAGTILHDAHAQVICAPSRASLLAGRHPYNVAWNYGQGSSIMADEISLAKVLQAVGYQTAVFGKYGLGAHDIDKEGAVPEGSSILPPCSEKKKPACDRLKFFEWLFSNESSGKPAAVVQDGPGWVGFNYSFVSAQGIQKFGPYNFFENDRLRQIDATAAKWWSPGIYQLNNGYKTAIAGGGQYPDQGGTGIFNGVESWKTDQFDNQILEKALEWLTVAVSNPEKPFFMHFCTAAVHEPHVAPALFHDGKTSVFGTTGSPHSDMIKSLDLTVGALVARLDDLSVLQNTIVVFLSDNGGLPAYYKTAEMYIAAGSPVAYPYLNASLALHSSAMSLRGWKGTVYEGGHRVPWIMRWDAGGSTVRAGTSLDHLVGIEDLYSTLLDIADIDSNRVHATGVTAGVQLPTFDMDSISFKAGLLDPNSASRRDIFVIMKHRNSVVPGGGKPDPVYGCRFQTWKAVFQAKTRVLSDVYDLAVDPGESINLLNTPGNVWEAFGSCGSGGPTSRAGYESVHKCCTALLSLVT